MCPGFEIFFVVFQIFWKIKESGFYANTDILLSIFLKNNKDFLKLQTSFLKLHLKSFTLLTLERSSGFGDIFDLEPVQKFDFF